MGRPAYVHIRFAGSANVVLCLIVLIHFVNLHVCYVSHKVPPAEHLAISCHRTILELCRSVPKEVWTASCRCRRTRVLRLLKCT